MSDYDNEFKEPEEDSKSNQPDDLYASFGPINEVSDQ